MEFTLRVPKQVLLVIGAVLAVVAGAATATLLPTPYEGRISYGAGQPWHSLHAPTSPTRYAIMSVLALIVYLDLVAATVRIPRPHARPVRRALHRAGAMPALVGG